MAAIIFLMNTLTGCALKNENMEAIYKEFLDNGDVMGIGTGTIRRYSFCE